jgi:hypothetical protein
MLQKQVLLHERLALGTLSIAPTIMNYELYKDEKDSVSISLCLLSNGIGMGAPECMAQR